MYPNEFARERIAADRASRLQDQADRSRLAADHRSPSIGVRGRFIVASCRTLRLDDVGAGRGRVSRTVLAPFAALERSCTDHLTRAVPGCC
jgi:hypothetical protein